MKRHCFNQLLYSFLFLFLLQSSHAQSTDFPYHLDPTREAVLLSAGTGMLLSGYLLDLKKPKITEQDILALDAGVIWGFDRSATANYSGEAAGASDKILEASMLLPLALAANRNIRHNGITVGVMLGEALLINKGLTSMTKSIAGRMRPYVYNPEAPLEHKMSSSARHSFFSGHTSHTAVVTFFTAKVFADLHPDSKWKPWVWTAAALIPAATGTCRYLGGRHYPSDILVGYGVGALTGILIPQMHKRPNSKLKIAPSMDMEGNGYVNVSLRW